MFYNATLSQEGRHKEERVCLHPGHEAIDSAPRSRADAANDPAHSSDSYNLGLQKIYPYRRTMKLSRHLLTAEPLLRRRASVRTTQFKISPVRFGRDGPVQPWYPPLMPPKWCNFPVPESPQFFANPLNTRANSHNCSTWNNLGPCEVIACRPIWSASAISNWIAEKENANEDSKIYCPIANTASSTIHARPIVCQYHAVASTAIWRSSTRLNRFIAVRHTRSAMSPTIRCAACNPVMM